MSLMQSIHLAIEFAARAHGDQKRKLGDLPYITHPMAVALMLSLAACPGEVIVAGILHDTLEDTPVTLEDIRRDFGPRVAFIVEGASELDKSLLWEERKRHTVDALRGAPLEVKMVVCADKLHNVLSIRRAVLEAGEEVWGRFRRGRERQEWYYRSLAGGLASDTDHEGYRGLLAEYRSAVEELFGKASP
jgi:(p)ppGpp synthase/HD superfamily hydrolase